MLIADRNGMAVSRSAGKPLKGIIFDFSSVQQLMEAVKECAEALGAQVINMPGTGN